jgi:hypothetical protein
MAAAAECLVGMSTLWIYYVLMCWFLPAVSLLVTIRVFTIYD